MCILFVRSLNLRVSLIVFKNLNHCESELSCTTLTTCNKRACSTICYTRQWKEQQSSADQGSRLYIRLWPMTAIIPYMYHMCRTVWNWHAWSWSWFNLWNCFGLVYGVLAKTLAFGLKDKERSLITESCIPACMSVVVSSRIEFQLQLCEVFSVWLMWGSMCFVLILHPHHHVSLLVSHSHRRSLDTGRCKRAKWMNESVWAYVFDKTSSRCRF